jgi:hypothetical protein
VAAQVNWWTVGCVQRGQSNGGHANQFNMALSFSDTCAAPAGARVRYLIYALDLDVDIKAPSELGGLKGEEYMALHPAGKMPLLVLPSGQAIPESAVRSALQWTALSRASFMPEQHVAALSWTALCGACSPRAEQDVLCRYDVQYPRIPPMGVCCLPSSMMCQALAAGKLLCATSTKRWKKCILLPG